MSLWLCDATWLSHDFPVLIHMHALGFNAHEFILDCRSFKSIKIEAVDIAKRLQDYGKSQVGLRD